MRTAGWAAAVLLALTANRSALALEDCDVNGQSVNPANGHTTQDKTGIMRCKDRDSGVLVREQELRAGKFEGLVRYYKDGKLSREFSVNAQGNRDGRAREFAPNGQLVLDETVRNGNAVGLVRSWYPEGGARRVSFAGEAPRERASVSYTKSGQIAELVCGPRPLLAPAADDAALCGFGGAPSVVQTYSDSGTVRGSGTWLNGQNLKQVAFHPNGKASSLDETQPDAQQRVQQNFSSDGVKIKEVVWTLKEQPPAKVVERAFAESGGTLVHEQKYAFAEDGAGRRQNRLAEETRFYLNGQPKSRDAYRREGAVELHEGWRFHDNGRQSGHGLYVVDGRYRERAVGIHQVFSEAGRLVRENHYDDKGRITRERAWDDSGQLLRDDALFEDGSRKAFAK